MLRIRVVKLGIHVAARSLHVPVVQHGDSESHLLQVSNGGEAESQACADKPILWLVKSSMMSVIIWSL
jgi:hypothetical protein